MKPRAVLALGALGVAALAWAATLGWRELPSCAEPIHKPEVSPEPIPATATIDAHTLVRCRVVCVRDEFGRAVPGVAVREAHLDAGDRWLGGRGSTVESDAEGMALFPCDAVAEAAVARLVYVVDEPARWLYRQWRCGVDVERVELHLVRGSSLSGRIVMEDGTRPESEAGVRVRFCVEDYEGEAYAPVVSGKFSFSNVVGGRIVGLWLDLPHAGGIASVFEPFDVDPGERVARDFKFDARPFADVLDVAQPREVETTQIGEAVAAPEFELDVVRKP